MSLPVFDPVAPGRPAHQVARRTTRRTAAPPAVLGLVLALVAAALAVASPERASASPGGDRFWAGEVYSGEFGAPSILRDGDTFYAYATNTSGNNLPVLVSQDLRTWRARDPWPVEAGYSTWKGYNDAMPFPARWAARRQNGKPGVWAPAVIKLRGRYVNAHAVQMRLGSARHCLTLATAPSPLGPFRDDSRRPLYCSSDPNGSIDPAWLQVGRKVYLIWKNAGVRGSKPTQIMARRMRPDGLRFARHSRAHVLLHTARPWEGNVIEAPSPIVYDGRIYLFYSGNIYTTSRYAIGYATCAGPLGPCRRGSNRPLLRTGGAIAGPGAQTPVVDKDGRLRLAYSAWRRGRVGYPATDSCLRTRAGCNQRRMYLATLDVGRRGKLTVTRRR
jgi:beta-xylosidase